MEGYKRLTVKDSNYYDEQDSCDVDEIYARLADLEDRIEAGTLVTVPYAIGQELYCVCKRGKSKISKQKTKNSKKW